MSNIDLKNNLQKRSELATVQDMLDKMKGQMLAALPKHITPDRMVRVALTAIQNTPKLLECDRNSLLMAILRAAQLGLEPDGILGQAYLIPYGKQVQLIPGYKGLIDLARRSGEVNNIIAREVCANDIFEVDFSNEIPFVHKPKLDGDRGAVKFFWAMARFKDGGFHWDYMSLEEVLKIRDGSSGWQSAVKYGKSADSPWSKYQTEMGKKTVIRRIAKYLPMSVQRASITEELIDSGRKFSTDEFGEIIMAEDDVQDVTPSNAGTEAVKDKLKKTTKPKAEVAQQAEPENSANSTTTAHIEEEKGEGVYLRINDTALHFPVEMTIVNLSKELQGMFPPDEKKFIIDNMPAWPRVLEIIRILGQEAAAKNIELLIEKYK